MTHPETSFVGTPRITQGSLLDFSTNPLAFMMSLREKSGDLVILQDGDCQILFAFGAENNRHILNDEETFESHFFVLRGSRQSAQRRLTSGLLNMNGPLHRQQRRQIQKPFGLQAIGAYQAIVKQLSQQMLATWHPGKTVDLAREMRDLLQRLTCRILFDLEDELLALRIGELLSEWMEINQELSTAAFVPQVNFASNYEELQEKADHVEAVLREIVTKHRSSNTQGKNSLLARLTSNEESSRDAAADNRLIGQLALFFAAGHLTTAYTLSWTLFLLTQHPDIEKQFWQEKPCGPRRPVTNDAASLSDRVIRESMRLLPVSAYLQRVLSRPLQVGQFELPKATPVIFSQYVTHHTEDVFETPSQFLPSRWESIHPTPYQYLPFGAGRRMCIGAPMALMIIGSVLESIRAHCRLRTVSGAQVDARVVSTILSPATSIPVQVCNRDDTSVSGDVSGNIHELVKLPIPRYEARRVA